MTLKQCPQCKTTIRPAYVTSYRYEWLQCEMCGQEAPRVLKSTYYKKYGFYYGSIYLQAQCRSNWNKMEGKDD